jgi:hypothetical protein
MAAGSPLRDLTVPQKFGKTALAIASGTLAVASAPAFRQTLRTPSVELFVFATPRFGIAHHWCRKSLLAHCKSLTDIEIATVA